MDARECLLAIQSDMAEVQQIAERISGNVLRLADLGIELPSMRSTANTLAQIALGWEAGDLYVTR